MQPCQTPKIFLRKTFVSNDFDGLPIRAGSFDDEMSYGAFGAAVEADSLLGVGRPFFSS